jgi:hypothetical protein
MKINTKKGSKRKKILLFGIPAVVLVALLGLSSYLYFFQGSLFGWQPFAPKQKHESALINYSPPTKDQRKLDQNIKENPPQGNGSNSENTGKANPTPTPEPTGETISIARANQPAAGQPVSIRTIVTGTSMDEKCLIVFAMDGHSSISKTVDITPQPTYSSCAALDVATSEFSASGTWQVSAQIVSGAKTVSNVATATVEVKK